MFSKFVPYFINYLIVSVEASRGAEAQSMTAKSTGCGSPTQGDEIFL